MDLNKWKSGIAKIESASSGGYKAYNPNTKALGKYQFVPRWWWQDIQKFAKDKGEDIKTHQDFLNNPKFQEEFMDYVYENKHKPQMEKLKKSVPNSGLDDGQLAALIHFKGYGHAEKWLKTGIDPTAKNNVSISKYFDKFDEGRNEYNPSKVEDTPKQKETPVAPLPPPSTPAPVSPAKPEPAQEPKVSDILKKTTGQKYDTIQDTTPYLASSIGGSMAEDKKKDYILDPAFGKSQQEKAEKKREELYKSIGEAYDTGKDYLGKGVDYVSDFFTPSEQEKRNNIEWLRKRGETERADALEKSLEEEKKKAQEPKPINWRDTQEYRDLAEGEAVDSISRRAQRGAYDPLYKDKVGAAEDARIAAEKEAAERKAKEEADVEAEPVTAVEADTAETPEADTGEEGEDNTQQVVSLFKEVPNPIDTAKERNLVTEEFLNEIASAKEAYNQTRDEIAQRRLWDGITKGLAQIAIGLYGQKTGLDLSGIKFDPMDWQSQMDQATRDLSAARTFAKDTKDVKMNALDERRDQRLREIQSTRQFNSDAISMLELERRDRKEKNSNLLAKIEKIEEQNMSVLGAIEDTAEYKSYKELESNIQKLYDKLPTVKKSKDQKEIIQRMQDYATRMDGSVANINKFLAKKGMEGRFGNAYPPEIFAPTKGWFGESTPSFKEISERSIKFLEGGSKDDVEEELAQLKQELQDAKGHRKIENAIKARIIELSKQR